LSFEGHIALRRRIYDKIHRRTRIPAAQFKKAEQHQAATERERYERERDLHTATLSGAIRSLENILHSNGDQNAANKEGERWWKIWEVIGLWATAAVGLIIGSVTITVSSCQLGDTHSALVDVQRAFITVSSMREEAIEDKHGMKIWRYVILLHGSAGLMSGARLA
jgi:hypothetical protein